MEMICAPSSANIVPNTMVCTSIVTCPRCRGPGKRQKKQSQTHHQQRGSRQQEEPVRCVKEHEAQAAPAVKERPQMRLAAPLVGPERDRNFCDLYTQLGRL